MPSLKIPDNGLLLESPDNNTNSGGSSPVLPLQAFAITLSDNVIEDIIKSVQNGDEIELSLGSSPTFFYGSHVHTLSPNPDSFTYDLFLSRPNDPQRKHYKLPSPAMSFWRKPGQYAPLRRILQTEAPSQNRKPAKPQGTKAVASSGDSDIEALRSSLAQAEEGKRQAVIIDKPPPNKKTTKTKSKLLSTSSIGNSVSRSLPASPALKPVASPPAQSASQQAMERAKGQRVMLVHELAAREQPYDYLRNRWTGDDKDFGIALNKVANFNEESQKWSMNKLFWKELNVWEYDYDSDDRELAIENAIRQFDRARLGRNEAVWDKLLPVEQRGKGKCLSRLQANLARGAAAAAPKIKVQKADAANGDDNDSDVSRPKGGEGMTRSISQPLPAKSKKTNDIKKILPPAKKPAASAKASPMGRNGTKTAATNGKFKSAEFVEDSSDDENDARPLAAPVAKPKPEPRAPVKEAPAVAKPKPKLAKPMVKEAPKPQSSKRPRDDDDSSSSSGAPLSKRIKPKEHIRPPVALKHRPSDASQNSRNSSGPSFKASKNTSPAKSSPLASSPPTNASDLESEAPVPAPAPMPRKERIPEKTVERTVEKPAEKTVEKTGEKRKASEAPVAAEPEKSKRQRVISSELISKAHKFQMFYEKYEALHMELSRQENPSEIKVADLLDMRERLVMMKSEIQRECPPELAVY